MSSVCLGRAERNVRIKIFVKTHRQSHSTGFLRNENQLNPLRIETALRKDYEEPRIQSELPQCPYDEGRNLQEI